MRPNGIVQIVLWLGLCAAAAAQNPEAVAVKPVDWRSAKPLKLEDVGITGGRAWITPVATFQVPGTNQWRHLLFYKKQGKNERQCWFVTVDLASGKVNKHPGMPGLEVLPSLWLGDKLYLGMNIPSNLLVYDPIADRLDDLGLPFEKSQSIFRMADAPDSTIALGGISPPEISLYDPRTKAFTRFGNAGKPGHGYVYYIHQDDEFIYGALRGNDPWELAVVNKKSRQRTVALTAPPSAFMKIGGGNVTVTEGESRKTYRLKDGQALPPKDEQPTSPAASRPQPPEVVYDDAPLLEGKKDLLVRYQGPARRDQWKAVGLEVPLAGETLVAACGMTGKRLAAVGPAYNPAVVFDVTTGQGRQAPMPEVSARSMLAVGDMLYVSGYPGTVLLRWDTSKPLTSPVALASRPATPVEDPQANPRVVARYPMSPTGGGHIGAQIFRGADGVLYLIARRHRHFSGFDVVWYDPAKDLKGEIDDQGALNHLQIGWACLIDGGKKLALATAVEPNDQLPGEPPGSAKLFVLDLVARKYVAQHTPLPGLKTLTGIAETSPGKLVGLALDGQNKTTFVYRFDLAAGKVEQVVRYDRLIQGVPGTTGLPQVGADFALGPDGRIWTAMDVAAELWVILRLDPKDLTLQPLGTAPGGVPRFVFQDGQVYLTGRDKLRRIVQ